MQNCKHINLAANECLCGAPNRFDPIEKTGMSPAAAAASECGDRVVGGESRPKSNEN